MFIIRWSACLLVVLTRDEPGTYMSNEQCAESGSCLRTGKCRYEVVSVSRAANTMSIFFNFIPIFNVLVADLRKINFLTNLYLTIALISYHF